MAIFAVPFFRANQTPPAVRLDQPPFSFLSDAAVPEFEPPDHFTVMDANCGLCAKGAAWIASNDDAEQFRIIPMQSKLGSALLQHYGMDAQDPSSWLYVQNGAPYTSLDAVIRIGEEFGGRWNALRLLRSMPRALQDWLYGVVARNRYRFMGRADLCNTSNPGVRQRLLQ